MPRAPLPALTAPLVTRMTSRPSARWPAIWAAMPSTRLRSMLPSTPVNVDEPTLMTTRFRLFVIEIVLVLTVLILGTLVEVLVDEVELDRTDADGVTLLRPDRAQFVDNTTAVEGALEARDSRF